MLESLVLFESVVNSRWFLRTSIILLLTKIDLFQDKLLKVFYPLLYGGFQAHQYYLEQVPLERCFPEYTGGPDINKATRYILWKFMQANKARLSVYPQYVTPPFIVLLSPLTLWLVWRRRQTKQISKWCSPSSKRWHCTMCLRTQGSYDPWALRAGTSVFLGSFSLLPAFLCRILSGCHCSPLLGEFLCFILFYFPFFFPVGDLLCVEVPRQMVSESKLYLVTDLALIFFDYYNFVLWFFFVLSCLVVIVLLITVRFPVLSFMDHPNPLPRMYTSPTCQCFLFTLLSYPTHTYSLLLVTLKWALLVMGYS